jgi:hypothetical protein
MPGWALAMPKIRRRPASGPDRSSSGSLRGDINGAADLQRLPVQIGLLADVLGSASAWKQGDLSLNRRAHPTSCLSMVLSENRYPLFGIML